MIVVLIGKLVAQLNLVTRYDFAKPDQRVLVSDGYFNLSEVQFEFVKELQQFILAGQGKYCFINDTYFDDSVLLQSYIKYIVSYGNFEDYKKVEEKKHSELHMACFINISQMKFQEGIKNEILAKSEYGTIKAAVEADMLRPL